MYRTLSSPQGGRIILDGREVINLAANNYLGLANHPVTVQAAKDAIDQYGVATTASRNICGNYPVHDELEEKLAKFKNMEATLVFNCGVSANSAVIPVLVGKNDVIYSDELNHGSIIDGCRLSGAQIKVFRHMDMAHLEELLKDELRPIFGAIEGGKLLGYCFCILQVTENDPVLCDRKVLYIDDLCVDEQLRGRGIASALYERVLEFARELGCHAVTLNVWCGNDGAMKFYEKCGMKPQKIGMETMLC